MIEECLVSSYIHHLVRIKIMDNFYVYRTVLFVTLNQTKNKQTNKQSNSVPETDKARHG